MEFPSHESPKSPISSNPTSPDSRLEAALLHKHKQEKILDVDTDSGLVSIVNPISLIKLGICQDYHVMSWTSLLFIRSSKLFSCLVEARRFCSSRWSTRTHTCGELCVRDVGKTTRLSGWLQNHRMNKFVVIRDAYGATQCVAGGNKAAWDAVETLPLESVLSVEGVVRRRPHGTEVAIQCH